MSPNLLPKLFAQLNAVREAAKMLFLAVARIPDVHSIKETESSAIENVLPPRFVANPEINGAPEDSLESLRESSIRNPVVREPEFFKDLSAGMEFDKAL